MNLHKNDTFITDVTFEEVYALYDLDRIIKNVVFKSILQVENILRSLISYEFSKKYGNDNYLKLENFETLKDSGCNYEKYQKRVAQIQTLLANLQSDIAKAITKRLYNSKNNQDIPDTKYHEILEIQKVNNRYICGKNDLFSLIIVLKILLPPDDFNILCNKINGRMESLKKIIHINYDEILRKMGFPKNWVTIKKT